MTRRRCAAAVGAVLVGWCLSGCARLDLSALPGPLSDAAFWEILTRFSEPGGAFQAQGGYRSDNLVSNERSLQDVIPELEDDALRGAYIGVGPEQNFTYIAAMRPTVAFVVDIRRQNMLLHLMYKALFELSPDRAEFLSRLFARKSLKAIARDASPRLLVEAMRSGTRSEELAQATLAAIVDRLERVHGFPLSAEDKASLKASYWPFFEHGPDIRWDPDGGSWIPTYAELMTGTDRDGHPHGFLASERNFQIVKRYETNNRIVPLVGDFAGPRTIRAVGGYLKDEHDVVAAFYTSNVQAYLTGDASGRFLENVATLPLDERSRFIRTRFQTAGRAGGPEEYRTSTVTDSMQTWVAAFRGYRKQRVPTP